MPQPRLAHLTAVLIQAHGKAFAGTAEVLRLDAWLTADGRLDQANQRQDQPARWLRGGQPVWSGWLRWLDQGWSLCAGNGEDTQVWRLDLQRLRPGEHLTLLNPNDEALVFRIVNVASAGG